LHSLQVARCTSLALLAFLQLLAPIVALQSYTHHSSQLAVGSCNIQDPCIPKTMKKILSPHKVFMHNVVKSATNISLQSTWLEI
jgi:hypothetical protein